MNFYLEAKLSSLAVAAMLTGFQAFIDYWETSLALLLLFTPAAVGVWAQSWVGCSCVGF